MTPPPHLPSAPDDDSLVVPRYVSPIPVRRAHLGDAILAEWTKIRSVRATTWTLGLMTALVLGVGLLVALLVRFYASEQQHLPPLVLGFFGVLLGSIPVIALGVLSFSAEYGTGLIGATLTACPSRIRVLVAKSSVYFAVVFTLTLAVTSIVGVLQVVVLDVDNPDAGAWVGATVGVSLYLAILGLLALATGALVRHSAGAITVMIGVLLLPLVLALFLISPFPDVGDSLFTYSVPSQLAGFYGDLSEFDNGDYPSVWTSLAILSGLTLAALVGAGLSLERRDV